LIAAGQRECIAMTGQRGGTQGKLFHSFNLDDRVPGDHLLRGID
jgi:hypothetical protein